MTCQKYQKDYRSLYVHMGDNDYWQKIRNKFDYYMNHLMSFRTFSAIVAVVFVLVYEKVFNILNMNKE